MDVFKLFQWENSLKAISNLEGLLQCCACNDMAEDAKCLGRCEHFFCAKCVENIKNGTCPKCTIPSPPCEMQPDRIIANLVASTKDLRHLLNGGEITNLEQGIEGPQLPSTPEQPCVPSKRVLDVITQPVVKQQKTTNAKKLSSDSSILKPSQVKVKEEMNTSKAKGKTKPADKGAAKKGTASNVTLSNKATKASSLPVTPQGKKIQKVANLSALGMSPNAPAINKRNTKGETMLHIACIKGDTERVKVLLGEGANPNSKDNAGWTPLHEACSHGFHSIAEMLLQNGAIVDVPGGESDENALHDAVTQGQVDVVKLLRSWGADDKARNRFGHTPRSLASLCAAPDELHSALDTPKDASIKRPPEMPPFLDKMVLLGSGLTGSQSKSLEQFAKMLKARLVSDFSLDVSHIVAACTADKVVNQKTPEYLMGIASGKWIVAHTWMVDCLSQGLALNPEGYEVLGTLAAVNTNAPRTARINASKMRPGLFSGWRMYPWGIFKEPFRNKKVLESLIKAGNGVVLGREPNPESEESGRTVPYHALPDSILGSCSSIILYEEGPNEPQIKYNMEHVKTLPLSWFVKCIENFRLLPPSQ